MIHLRKPRVLSSLHSLRKERSKWSSKYPWLALMRMIVHHEEVYCVILSFKVPIWLTFLGLLIKCIAFFVKHSMRWLGNILKMRLNALQMLKFPSHQINEKMSSLYREKTLYREKSNEY